MSKINLIWFKETWLLLWLYYNLINLRKVKYNVRPKTNRGRECWLWYRWWLPINLRLYEQSLEVGTRHQHEEESYGSRWAIMIQWISWKINLFYRWSLNDKKVRVLWALRQVEDTPIPKNRGQTNHFQPRSTTVSTQGDRELDGVAEQTERFGVRSDYREGQEHESKWPRSQEPNENEKQPQALLSYEEYRVWLDRNVLRIVRERMSHSKSPFQHTMLEYIIN